MIKHLRFPALVLSCTSLLSLPAFADVKPNGLVSDHMVLQSDAAVPVWGTAAPGESVTVEFASQKKSTKADAMGRWMVKLDALPPSGESRSITITGKNRIVVADVMVGDVWFASGQSNMASSVGGAEGGDEAAANAGDTQLRFFDVKKKTAAEPQSEVEGKWVVSAPDTAKNFSAVAYFMAQQLRVTQKRPIGVMQAAWGGTPIQIWMSLAGLKKEPAMTPALERWNAAAAQAEKLKANPQLLTDYQADYKKWKEEVEPSYTAAVKAWEADKAAGKAVGAKPKPSRNEPETVDPMGMPSASKRPHTPTVAFNTLVSPLTPFPIRGAIWYQGEENGSGGLEYRSMLPRLIEDWRSAWGIDFPFLIVQLPANGIDKQPVADSGWAWLREAQFMALRTPKTGMVITIDIGDPNNVHPKDKLDVGLRAALVARKLVYGENIVASGPLYKGFAVQGNAIRVQFTETGGGLTPGQAPWCAPGVAPLPTDKLVGFFIAGDDKKWVAADAKIDGTSVLVSSAEVPKPAAVRYGWAASPRCNLYNKESLPASPFRTDDWPK